MRKTLVAVALTCAFPAAFSQSRGPEADLSLASGSTRVELYGLVDGGYEYYNFGDKSVSRLASGMSAGSRWGLRGSENLGNGFRAVFVLESRFSIDTGSVTNNNSVYSCGVGQYVPGGTATTINAQCPGPNGSASLPLASPLPPTAALPVRIGLNAANALLLDSITTVNGAGALFDRQAFLGLVTPVGIVAFGRQYTPGYEILNRFNAFADQTAGQMGQNFATLKIRSNNAAMYRAELKGFTLAAMYGFGGSEGSSANPSLRNERSGAPTNGDDFYGANVQYANDLFSVGVGYNHDNVVPWATPTTKKTGLETLNAGATLNLGPAKFFAQYMKRKNDNPIVTAADMQQILIVGGQAGLLAAANSLQLMPYDVDTLRGVAGKTDTSVYHLGVNWRVGPGNLIAAWNNAKDSARSVWQTADAKANHYAVSYFYDFSRRTQLYGVYAYMDNSGPARMGLNSAGYTSGFATTQGVAAYAVQAGLRHSF
ncbi:MAG: porin [Burkholderiaceae bacterium]